jgi:hypothetical protein
MLGIGREILGAILGYLITELFKWLATLPLLLEQAAGEGEVAVLGHRRFEVADDLRAGAALS